MPDTTDTIHTHGKRLIVIVRPPGPIRSVAQQEMIEKSITKRVNDWLAGDGRALALVVERGTDLTFVAVE